MVCTKPKTKTVTQTKQKSCFMPNLFSDSPNILIVLLPFFFVFVLQIQILRWPLPGKEIIASTFTRSLWLAPDCRVRVRLNDAGRHTAPLALEPDGPTFSFHRSSAFNVGA